MVTIRTTMRAVAAGLVAGLLSFGPVPHAAAQYSIQRAADLWRVYHRSGDAALNESVSHLNASELKSLSVELAIFKQATDERYAGRVNPFANFIWKTEQMIAPLIKASEPTTPPVVSDEPTTYGNQSSVTTTPSSGGGGGSGGSSIPTGGSGGGSGGGSSSSGGSSSGGSSSGSSSSGGSSSGGNTAKVINPTTESTDSNVGEPSSQPGTQDPTSPNTGAGNNSTASNDTNTDASSNSTNTHTNTGSTSSGSGSSTPSGGSGGNTATVINKPNSNTTTGGNTSTGTNTSTGGGTTTSTGANSTGSTSTGNTTANSGGGTTASTSNNNTTNTSTNPSTPNTNTGSNSTTNTGSNPLGDNNGANPDPPLPPVTSGSNNTSGGTSNLSTLKVYDAIMYTGKPALSESGLMPIKAVYESALWPDGVKHDQPHEATVRAVARTLPTNVPVVIDIESWSQQPAELDATIDKFIKVAQWIRAENPNVKFGFYSILPQRNYWAAVLGPGPNTGYAGWIKANEKLQRVADHVDYIFPSLYTFYNDVVGWRKYALNNIVQARQYGKPVIAFLWPQYHDSSKFTGQFLDANYWRTEMMTCASITDGMVIWGGYQQPFDASWDWWQVTQELVHTPLAAVIGD
ncbi:MAG: hypothetical protein GC162_11105 [Planctomycetes bacterium]|nr:hypothetical protein [Planctomycetota bacterium]